MRKLVYSSDGRHRVVGVIEGQTFKKTIKSKHFVHKHGEAISIEGAAFEECLIPNLGLNGVIEVRNKDDGVTYQATVRDFFLHGLFDDLGGGVGPHYFLPKQYWTILPPKQQRLPLEMEGA